MREIKLSQGMTSKISDHRFEYLNQWKWHAEKMGNRWYETRVEGLGATQKTIRMHRVITNAPDGMEVDHWDNDGLNNQDENLRICTRAQNSANKTKQSNNTSGYKGVNWYEQRKKWRAYIVVSGVQKFLKYWNTREDAARAYDKAAKEHFGEFAKLNFPDYQATQESEYPR